MRRGEEYVAIDGDLGLTYLAYCDILEYNGLGLSLSLRLRLKEKEEDAYRYTYEILSRE